MIVVVVVVVVVLVVVVVVVVVAAAAVVVLYQTDNYIIMTNNTANLRTNIVDFRGVDASIILIIRGGILMSIGDFPESLSQAILEGIMLVGKLLSFSLLLVVV